MSDDVPVHPAATVILVRDGETGLETLLVHRSADLAFHGGSWVFPGGRVDDDDFLVCGRDDIESAARNAAVREAREEAGLVVDPTTLVPWAHWTTPPGRNRRFATWFYLAPAPAGSDDITIDGGEIQDHRWFTPGDALASRERGDIVLPPPTFVSILRLSSCATVAEASSHAHSHPYLFFAPKPVKVEGGIVTLYDGDAAFDDAPRGLERPGARHRLVMVGDDWRYERSP